MIICPKCRNGFDGDSCPNCGFSIPPGMTAEQRMQYEYYMNQMYLQMLQQQQMMQRQFGYSQNMTSGQQPMPAQQPGPVYQQYNNQQSPVQSQSYFQPQQQDALKANQNIDYRESESYQTTGEDGGEEIADEAPKKPVRKKVSKQPSSDMEKAPFQMWKLVSGIICMVLFMVVIFQSCAAGIVNTIGDTGESSGTAGFLLAMFMLCGGIVSVVTRKSMKPAANIALAVLFGIAFLMGLTGVSGIFGDLFVWTAWCGVCLSMALATLIVCKTRNNRLGIIIAIAGSVLCFAATGIGIATSNDDEKAVANNTEWTSTPSTEPSDSISTSDSMSTSQSGDAQSAFSEVLVSNDQVKFELTKEEIDGIWGYTWHVYMENNTDSSLMFSVEEVSVNGIMLDPFWATSVESGKKKNSEISWASTSLQEKGIDEVSVVEMRVHIYNDEDWAAEPVFNEIITVYPRGESAAVNMERIDSDDDIVLFDNDECAMTVTGFDSEGFWGYTVQVYLENKTDKALMFSIDNASVNGYMADPFWAQEVAAQKKSMADITWMDSVLEESGIEIVEEIEVTVRVYEASSYDGEYLVEDTFTIRPQ